MELMVWPQKVCLRDKKMGQPHLGGSQSSHRAAKFLNHRVASGSISTILSIDSRSSGTSNGARSTVFVPPLSSLDDISDFQSNVSRYYNQPRKATTCFPCRWSCSPLPSSCNQQGRPVFSPFQNLLAHLLSLAFTLSNINNDIARPQSQSQHLVLSPPQPPPATAAAEKEDPRPLTNKNKVFENSTSEKTHSRGRQNAKPHNKCITRSASHSTTRGRRKPNRQPSPPLEVTLPIS
jgi:hypothetical protein